MPGVYRNRTGPAPAINYQSLFIHGKQKQTVEMFLAESSEALISFTDDKHPEEITQWPNMHENPFRTHMLGIFFSLLLL